MIILASQSPQRKALMKTLGIEFRVIPADIDEQAVTEKDPKKRAVEIAKQKALSVHTRYPNSIIIAADTYIILNDKILEKPQSLAEAREMLEQQSGRVATEVTGFYYVDGRGKSEGRRAKENDKAHGPGFEYGAVAEAEVAFRDLTQAEIEKYVTTQPVLTWSAAFCPAYDSGVRLIKKINGSFSGFTHGLPLEELIPQLERSGVM